jgi:hypothetical protein
MSDGELELNAITLNTIDRITNSTIDQPIYQLDKPLYNVKSYKVKNITIPLNTYNIDSRNNRFYFIDDADQSQTYTVILTEQQYTASQLATELKSKMDAVSAYTFTVTFNSQTNKFTFACSGTFLFVPYFEKDIYYELGLTSADMGTFQSTITPSNVIDLSGVKVVSVVCSSFTTNYKQGNYNIIASASVTEKTGDIVTFTDNSNDYININENSISQLQFILLDERGRKITVTKDWILTLYVYTS